MYVNKKLGRFKQWAGERMGSDAKTRVSDDFKSMEVEMGLRHEGLEKMHRSMTSYIKVMSKRGEGDKEAKSLPVSFLGSIMTAHGKDFADDSEFGQCLQSMGDANQRIGRIQEVYVQDVTTSWLDALERSLTQMKEYNAARKKLESRRLAYDAAQSKMEKSKKEDFKIEDELSSARVKYEESCEDAYRRMDDIKEAEADNIADLGTFVDAELRYYDRCRDVLLSMKQSWPGRQQDMGRSWRQNSNDSYSDEFSPAPETRPSIKSQRTIPNTRQPPAVPYATNVGRPAPVRSVTTTCDGSRRPWPEDKSRSSPQPISRLPGDNVSVRLTRDQFRRAVEQTPDNHDTFSSPSDDSTPPGSPERWNRGLAGSPATSYGSSAVMSRNASWTGLEGSTKKAPPPPPPPPPSRKTKPPPPPLPMKRSALVVPQVYSQ